MAEKCLCRLNLHLRVSIARNLQRVSAKFWNLNVKGGEMTLECCKCKENYRDIGKVMLLLWKMSHGGKGGL